MKLEVFGAGHPNDADANGFWAWAIGELTSLVGHHDSSLSLREAQDMAGRGTGSIRLLLYAYRRVSQLLCPSFRTILQSLGADVGLRWHEKLSPRQPKRLARSESLPVAAWQMLQARISQLED